MMKLPTYTSNEAGSDCQEHLVRLSSFVVAAAGVIPQGLARGFRRCFVLLPLLFRQPGRLFEKLNDSAVLFMQRALPELERGKRGKDPRVHLALLCMRLFMWGQAARFWWYWLRVVHKHGREKAVVDVRCRFWGFKFLPNV